MYDNFCIYVCVCLYVCVCVSKFTVWKICIEIMHINVTHVLFFHYLLTLSHVYSFRAFFQVMWRREDGDEMSIAGQSGKKLYNNIHVISSYPFVEPSYSRFITLHLTWTAFHFDDRTQADGTMCNRNISKFIVVVIVHWKNAFYHNFIFSA